MFATANSSPFTTLAGTFGTFAALVSLAISFAPAVMHMM